MKRVLVLVLTLVMVIGLAGVADTTITQAEEPEEPGCPTCKEKGPDEGTAGITQAECNTSDGGLMESGEGYIIMDVDCWHAGWSDCQVCDELGDYDCAILGWEPWLPCCFSDLVPEGNVVTKIEAEYRAVTKGGGTISVYINDNLVGSGAKYGPFMCDECSPITVTSDDYPEGFPGYVYGGTNELKIVDTGDSCVSDVHLKIYYEDPISAILERLAALEAENEELENRLADAEAKLHEEVQPRLDALEAAESCIKAVVDWLIEHVIPSGLINQAEKKGHPMPECP